GRTLIVVVRGQDPAGVTVAADGRPGHARVVERRRERRRGRHREDGVSSEERVFARGAHLDAWSPGRRWPWIDRIRPRPLTRAGIVDGAHAEADPRVW